MSKCESKLYRDGKEKFEINTATSVYKQKYQCSNDECNHNLRPLWEDYFKPESNYTDYPVIITELGCNHKKFNFHKMQNFMNKIKGTLCGLKNKIKSNKDKIEKNESQIAEIKKLRLDEVGKVNLNNE